MVTVKIFAPLGPELDQRGFKSNLTVNLDLASGTLADVVKQLAAKYGAKVNEELLDEEGNLDYVYGIFSDGERIDGLATRIQDGAELDIIMMIGGG